MPPLPSCFRRAPFAQSPRVVLPVARHQAIGLSGDRAGHQRAEHRRIEDVALTEEQERDRAFTELRELRVELLLGRGIAGGGPADADPGVDFAFGIDLTGLEALVGLIMFFIGGAFWASRMYDWQGDRKPRLQ